MTLQIQMLRNWNGRHDAAGIYLDIPTYLHKTIRIVLNTN